MEKRVYSLSSLNTDVSEQIDLDTQKEWLKLILDELNEAAGEEEAGMVEQTHLAFSGEIKKSKNAKFGEYVLISGEIRAKFVTQCVVTGSMMFDQIDCEILAANIAKHNQERLGLEEGETVFLEDEERELFFFDRGEVDLEPVLHEFIYLNKNPYPSSKDPGSESPQISH